MVVHRRIPLRRTQHAVTRRAEVPHDAHLFCLRRTVETDFQFPIARATYGIGLPSMAMDTGLGGPLGIEAAGEHGVLDFLNRLGHVDIAGTGAGAVEDGAATPDALGVVEDLEPIGGRLIA